MWLPRFYLGSYCCVLLFWNILLFGLYSRSIDIVLTYCYDIHRPAPFFVLLSPFHSVKVCLLPGFSLFFHRLRDLNCYQFFCGRRRTTQTHVLCIYYIYFCATSISYQPSYLKDESVIRVEMNLIWSRWQFLTVLNYLIPKLTWSSNRLTFRSAGTTFLNDIRSTSYQLK